jgi:hypothetical protein
MFYNVKIQEDRNQQPKLRRTTILLRRTGNFRSGGTALRNIPNLIQTRLTGFSHSDSLVQKREPDYQMGNIATNLPDASNQTEYLVLLASITTANPCNCPFTETETADSKT